MEQQAHKALQARKVLRENRESPVPMVQQAHKVLQVPQALKVRRVSQESPVPMVQQVHKALQAPPARKVPPVHKVTRPLRCDSRDRE